MRDKIRFFEEIAANSHVALNVVQYDGWLLRFANGHTSRANSISMIYPSFLPFEEKVSVCEEYYKKQGLPCLFKVTEVDSLQNDFLVSHGYEAVNSTYLMSLDLSNIKIDSKFFESCKFFETPAEEWLEPYFIYEEINEEKYQNTFRKMLAKVQSKTCYGAVLDGDKIVACASIAIEHGYALLQNVVVSQNCRGKGFGKKLCKAMLVKAKEFGAKHAYLQVLQKNEVALNLYKNLGFCKEYEYWYMKK